MKIMKSLTVNNIYGVSYVLTVRKHNEDEFDKYGFPYSMTIRNTDEEAFDLNNHIFLYDEWQVAYKMLKVHAKEYENIEVAKRLRKTV